MSTAVRSAARMKAAFVVAVAALLASSRGVHAVEPSAVGFDVKLETVLKHHDDQFHWYHPRAAALPSSGGDGPVVMMTVQKILNVSDYFAGLHVMRSRSRAEPWQGPVLPPALDWRPQKDGVTVSVADVTPGWHDATARLLAIGCQVRYSPQGRQLEDAPRSHQTAYAVYDPKADRWVPWRIVEMPPDDHFNFARNACSQWIVKPDGRLLVPLYIGRDAKEPFSVTVAECQFDGTTLGYVRHGSILRLNSMRGYVEPSLVAFHGRHFLTLRNDVRAYVSVSDDGLEFAEPVPWRFDDGEELGSSNTQQHWLAHAEGLFLVYTRRGANNDHVFRHRAPLFIAQVDPVTLRVMRATEKVIVPERGADLGNFGACAIDENESWVTTSEGMLVNPKEAMRRGAEGATFVARILWSKPNTLARRPTRGGLEAK